jgi:diguanylate cyclase (GGDEF)-like protein
VDDEFEAGTTGELTLPPRARSGEKAFLLCVAGPAVGETYEITKEITVIGRSGVDVRVLDEGVSRRHAHVSQREGRAALRDLGSRNGTFLNGARITERPLTDGDKIQIGNTIFKFTLQDAIDQNFQRQMFEAALRDPLTKLFNRRYLLDRLAGEVAFAQRHRSPLALLLIDIDHFKSINDTYGHLAGDHVLSSLAQLMSGTIRKEDVLARYGGEEFALIGRDLDLHHATVFAERLRRLIEPATHRYEAFTLRVTVSVGAAELVPGTRSTVTELIQRADKALYRAKQGGRNRVDTAR